MLLGIKAAKVPGPGKSARFVGAGGAETTGADDLETGPSNTAVAAGKREDAGKAAGHKRLRDPGETEQNEAPNDKLLRRALAWASKRSKAEDPEPSLPAPQTTGRDGTSAPATAPVAGDGRADSQPVQEHAAAPNGVPTSYGRLGQEGVRAGSLPQGPAAAPMAQQGVPESQPGANSQLLGHIRNEHPMPYFNPLLNLPANVPYELVARWFAEFLIKDPRVDPALRGVMNVHFEVQQKQLNRNVHIEKPELYYGHVLRSLGKLNDTQLREREIVYEALQGGSRELKEGWRWSSALVNWVFQPWPPVHETSASALQR